MAFAQIPNSWIPGWTVGTVAAPNTHISFPIASIQPAGNLTLAEAGLTGDGDVRKIWYALCEHMFQLYTTRASATPVAAPVRMRIEKGSSVNSITGRVTNNYTWTFENLISGQDVAPE